MSATTLPVALAPGAALSARAALERMACGDTLLVAHLRTWQTTTDPDPDEDDEDDDDEDEDTEPRLVVVGHSLGGWLRSQPSASAQPAHLSATRLATLIRLGVIAPLPAQTARGVSLYADGADDAQTPALRLDVAHFALSPLGSVALALGARLASTASA